MEKLEYRIGQVERKLEKACADIFQLKISEALLKGKADQKSVYAAYVIALIGLVLSLIGLIQ